VEGINLLLGDAALPAGLVRLGAPKDHETAIGQLAFRAGFCCPLGWHPLAN
jgi:hypothetical protein